MQRENPAQGFSLFEKRTRFQKRPRVRILKAENAACAFLHFCVFPRGKRPFSDRVFRDLANLFLIFSKKIAIYQKIISIFL